MKNPTLPRDFRHIAQIFIYCFMDFTENRMICLHFLRICAIIKLNFKGMRGTLTRSFRTLSKESRPQPDGFSFYTDPFYYNINEQKKQVRKRHASSVRTSGTNRNLLRFLLTVRRSCVIIMVLDKGNLHLNHHSHAAVHCLVRRPLVRWLRAGCFFSLFVIFAGAVLTEQPATEYRKRIGHTEHGS